MKILTIKNKVEGSTTSWKKLRKLMDALGVEDMEDLELLIVELRAWYKGNTGMKSNLAPTIQKRILNTFRTVSSIYTTKKPKYAYRMANVKVPSTGLKKSMNLKIGNRDLLSFTKDPKFPKVFYTKFYKGLNTRKDKRFAYVTVKVPVTSKNFIIDTDTVLKVLKDISDSQIELKNWHKELSGKSVKLPSPVKEARHLLKTLKTKFYQEQKEIILHIPKATTKVEIVEVLHSSEDK